MRKMLVFASLPILLLWSCNFMDGRRVRGDGNVTTQSRSVSNFSRIDVSGAIDVYVSQDSAFSVKVEIDNNLQEFIEVEREGDILRIHQRNNINLQASNGGIKVYVTAPVYSGMEASGACKIVGQNALVSPGNVDINLSGSCDVNLDIKAQAVSVDASGASSITLKGETRDFKVGGSGSTDVRAFELLAENASIDISGAGDVEVYASKKLDASASGSSDVKYKGNASVSSDMSGSGSVKKVE